MSGRAHSRPPCLKQLSHSLLDCARRDKGHVAHPMSGRALYVRSSAVETSLFKTVVPLTSRLRSKRQRTCFQFPNVDLVTYFLFFIDNITLNHPVSQSNNSMRIFGYVLFVGNEDNGIPCLVDFIEQVHYLKRSF